jgi:sortase A
MRDPLVKAGVIGLSVALVLALFAAGFAVFVLRDGPGEAVASRDKEPTFEPLTRSDPPGEAWQEEVRDVEQKPAPVKPPPEPRPEQAQAPLPVETPDWPEPEEGEIAQASETRDYGALPSGAILGLTIDALGVQNAPVWGSDAPEYLDRGVVHIPETSLPWTNAPQRNTFLAAHRIGYPGTGSRLLFYNLDTLQNGDRVTLEDPDGKTYQYEVSEMFVVGPYDSWVMGQVVDRDMVTLQTCTPIPTFEKRLIVRADRV